MIKYKFESLFLEKIFFSIHNKRSTLKTKPFSFLYGKFSLTKKEINELDLNFPINLSDGLGEELGRGLLKLNNNDGWKQLNYNELQTFWLKKLSHKDTLFIIRALIEKLSPPQRFKVSAAVLFWQKFLNVLSKIFHKSIQIRDFIQKLSLIDLTIKEEGVLDDDNFEMSYEWTFVEDKALDKSLPSHTDSGKKLLTLLLPMTIEENSEINGVSIYSANRRVISFDSSRKKRELFIEKFRAKHLIGTYTAFPKRINSWHGVELSMSSATRKTLILNVYRSKSPFE